MGEVTEQDCFKLKKPWWKFWFKPWVLRVKKDHEGELWLIDPYGAWYTRIGDYTSEEFERTFEWIK